MEPDWIDIATIGGVHTHNEVQVDCAAHPDAPKSIRFRHRLRGTGRWWAGWPSDDEECNVMEARKQLGEIREEIITEGLPPGWIIRRHRHVVFPGDNLDPVVTLERDGVVIARGSNSDLVHGDPMETDATDRRAVDTIAAVLAGHRKAVKDREDQAWKRDEPARERQRAEKAAPVHAALAEYMPPARRLWSWLWR